MKNIFHRPIFTLLILVSLIVGVTGCGANLQKLQNVVDEMREHNKNIQKVTNDFFAAGKIERIVLAGVNAAGEKFSTGLNSADASIAAAKLIKEKGSAKSALDFARRVVDTDVFPAFMAIGKAIINVPPEVEAKIETYLAAIRILFSTLTTLFAAAETAIGGREAYV